MTYQPAYPGGGAPQPGGHQCACGAFPQGQFCEQCGTPNPAWQQGFQAPQSPAGFGQGYAPGDPYGQPSQPPQDPYGQPQQDPYGQPQQDPYGQQPGYGQDPYGQPSQPPQDPYGQPQQDPYGQQYGAAPASAPPAPTSEPPGPPPGVPAAPFGAPTSAPPSSVTGGFSVPDAQPHDVASNYAAPGQQTTTRWVVAATADQGYFNKVAASDGASQLQYPSFAKPRRFPMDKTELTIGRYSAKRGVSPDIDLSGDVADPGVSAQHAKLFSKPDGSWTIMDVGSSNGTFLNGSDEPLTPNVEVPLSDGSYLNIGAWTRLTIHYEG